MKPSEDEGYEVNGSCSVKGGSVDKGGIATFEQNAKGGALEGKAKKMEKIAKDNGVPPKLFMAIVASESQWGKGPNATTQNNPLSIMGSGPIKIYPTIEKGLDAGAKNLNDLYISQGLNTPEKIGPKYAPVGASNDPTDLNSNWVPTVKQIMGEISGKDGKVTGCSKGGGKSIKISGDLPKWSNSDPGKNNLYTAGQCTWYAYGIRDKLGKPISTMWGDAHNWDDRAKSEGYKVDDKAEKGAVFVAEQGAGGHDSYYGHVGIVIGTSDGGKKFRISEMNYEGEFKVNERDLTMTSGYSFIHDK